jgi:integrase
VFTLLLVTAPRIAALASRDVEHYIAGEQRIDYGQGRGKKGRGQGKLDERTDAELRAYLGGRTEGPLALSPRGNRLDRRNMLRWWREAFSLGLVWELWPEEVWDVDLAHLVNQSLLTRSTQIRASGNPLLLRDDTRRARKKLRGRIAGLTEELREDWEERMDRVTLHSFRHTHETWARALGVDQVLINLQVGWRVSGRASDGFDVMRIASKTGLSRYLDARSKLLDARKSAIAVRRLLDEAQERVDRELAEGRSSRSA